MYEHDKIIEFARQNAREYMERTKDFYPVFAGCLESKIFDLCYELNKEDVEDDFRTYYREEFEYSNFDSFLSGLGIKKTNNINAINLYSDGEISIVA